MDEARSGVQRRRRRRSAGQDGEGRSTALVVRGQDVETPSYAEPASRGPLGESWRAWTALAVGVLAVSAQSALAYGMSPLLKSITEELSWSRSEYAAAMNFRLLLIVAMVPVVGRLVDRLGARVVLFSGAFAIGLGTLLMAQMSSLWGFWISGLLTGPGQAAVGTVASSALVLRLFRRRQGLAIGILNGGDNLITSGVHIGSAYLLVHAGWRGAFGGLAVGYLALAVLVLVALRSGEGGEESEPKERESSGASPIPWGEARFWLLIVVYVILYGYVTTIGLHFPAFQQDLGRTADVAAWIYGFSTMVGAGGSILAGWTSERIGSVATLRWVVLGLLASSIALWSSIGVGAYYVWAAGYGIVNAGAVALLALVVRDVFRGASFGRLMGVVYAFCMAATVAANTFASAIFDASRSYILVWQVYSVLLLLALVPLQMLVRRTRRVAEADAPLHRPGRTAS